MSFVEAYEREQAAKRAVVYVARVLLRAPQWNGREVVFADVGYGWKVGHSTNLHARGQSLVARVRDVEFVAATHGSLRDERTIHRAMRPHALDVGPDGVGLRGLAREWYPDTAEVRAFLDALPMRWRGSVRLISPERERSADPRLVSDELGRAWQAALSDRCALAVKETPP